jgi:hypothetical protein
MLPLEKTLIPQTAWSAMVVVSGNRQDWNSQLTDGATGRRHGGFAGGGRVEEITSNNNELDLMCSHDIADSSDHLNALLLNECALLWIINTGEGFAQLPIGGVQKAGGHNSPTIRS